MALTADVISIFPDYLAPLELSLPGKAREKGLLDVRVHDLRDWATDKHRTVDDSPYGGGAGMVMKPDVWGDALDAVVAEPPVITRHPGPYLIHDQETEERPTLIVPTPSGQAFDQRIAEELAGQPWLVFACGRYEGIDARFVADAQTKMPVRELSIGDYVLNGGEVAALVVLEAVVRLLPGVVGNPDSLIEESHSEDGLLEYPVYTKPPTWRGQAVPGILLSGDHAKTDRWRRDEAIRRTARQRPDLLARLDPDQLDDRDLEVLNDLGFRPGQPPMAK